MYIEVWGYQTRKTYCLHLSWSTGDNFVNTPFHFLYIGSQLCTFSNLVHLLFALGATFSFSPLSLSLCSTLRYTLHHEKGMSCKCTGNCLTLNFNVANHNNVNEHVVSGFEFCYGQNSSNGWSFYIAKLWQKAWLSYQLSLTLRFLWIFPKPSFSKFACLDLEWGLRYFSSNSDLLWHTFI